ncbi:hypothetical protein IWW36_003056 [Coemansia brasiliensis]|uniref:PHD-type domain-containing protein n=1 Tax=Coemansia brasiliensis TaxID=2650707 RepID=A0A9W8I650_9FUNG|nr:hypothetical protein IWW36_003056 [Coemansia brasiliensis]
MSTFVEQTAEDQHASTSKSSLISPPIEDLNYDSSGSLSSLDSELDLLTDIADPAEASGHKEPIADSVSTGDTIEPVASSSPPAKRKRGRPCKPKNAPPDIVTTGAFMTRATLRKLGMAEVSTNVDTIEAVLSTGSKVKVLNIDKHWYTAVVLAINKGKVMVHYPDWDHSFNEWIPIDSRRLVYRGKNVGNVSGALEALKQLENNNLDTEDPELVGFDLAEAISKAFSPDSDNGREGKVLRTVDSDHSVKLDDSLIDTSNLRGRPKGSKNRRRAGHIKNRPRKSAAKKVDTDKQAIESSEPVAEREAPPIPVELRIPEVRLAPNSDNPYARQHCPEEIFGSDSDANADTAMARSESNRVSSQSGNSTDKASSIWHLTRGPYVTTGAFLTRRAIKSLAQSEATGGIIQEHHGYYPGQLVEVLNADRKWYMGRVITYANKKFLVHYNGWNHSQNEWIAAGSKRMCAAREVAETEEEARKICVVLVDEYNAYIDEVEKKKAERIAAKRKAKPVCKIPANIPTAKSTSNAMSHSINPASSDEDEQAHIVEDETDEDVEPISVDSGYTQVPQLLRVKDYVKLFSIGMAIAARDRNKLWWKAEIVGIKHFRLRVHYTGFSSYWDEWMEMNTQRIMLVSSSDTTPTEQDDELLAGDSTLENLDSAKANATGTVNTANQHQKQNSGESQKGKNAQPSKRLGRPPNPETKSTPLSLRLALKALENDREMYEQCHPEELDVFHLPKEHMSMRDYSTFLKVGDRVRIRDSDKQWYECTIIDFRHCRIRVCFNGRSDESNQWIPVNSDRIRVLRETIDGDKRLEKLERESRIALRRKREKLRALRRKRAQVSVASLVRLAESLEYIVDQEEPASGNSQIDEAAPDNGVESIEDQPLLQVMLEKDSDAFDSMPLMTRMMLTEHFNRYRLSSRVGHSGCAIEDSATWFVYCNLCNVVIRTFRYYCVSCEKPSDGYDYESYDLCLMCFSKSFPTDHPHPPTCFARSAVGNVDGVVQFTSNVLSKYRKQSLAANSDSSVDMFAGVVAVYEPDEFDTSYNMPSATSNTWSKLAVGLHGTTTWMDDTGQSAVLGRIAGRSRRSHISDVIEPGNGSDKSDANGSNDRLSEIIPRCAFCGEDALYESGLLGGFAGDHPFILASTSEDGTLIRRRFWAHDACARYSPEVLVSDSGKWFNVAAALRRGRTIKCAICKRRGATVGCFHGRCQKSYHVVCTQKPKEFFEQGFTFWCPRHSRIVSGGSRLGRDALDEEQHTARCANCNHELSGDLMWMTCLECPNEPKRQFNICLSCYDSKDALVNHPHKKRCFREHLSHAGGVSSTGKYLVGRSGPGRKPKNPAGCHYCRSRQSRRWRKGYGGVVMCETCFNTAHSLQGGSQDKQLPANTLYEPDLFADDNEGSGQLEVVALNPFGSSLVTTDSGSQKEQQQQQPVQTSALVEDYAQSIYFTRETCIASNRIGMSSVSQQPLGQLSSYGPTDSMLFTLAIDSSYFDIPGRAPRWGSHSGTDYHGTWLPQTVRRALLRYTKRGDRVLSNFLGRGTDAIECFLLSRKCIGVDINPSAVALAQRNCSFTIMPDSGMSVEFRPAIMQGDARQLSSGLWPGAAYFAEPESFDHILSHPPYKDCVLYSTNIDGDLSRFPGPEEFQREMEKVVSESWRLLRMGRHLTLGIGDNRAECFYIPVSYQLFRTYINHGFELEELIVKRQRYCQAFGLGTYLCVQFDFLMFTHEFIATLRKVPQDQVDRMHLTSEQYAEHKDLGFHGHATSDSMFATGSKLGGLVAIKGRTLREVPPSPIERKSVVMGSVWTFEPHPVFLFSHLCMSRMVQRFGRDESNWEQIDLALENKKIAENQVQLEAANIESGNNEQNDDMSDSEPEFADNGTRAGGYELERQRQIQENREQLLHLGLVSELGEDSTDTAHYQKMVAMYPRLPLDTTPLALIVVPHISNLEFKRCHIEPYRQALVQITHDASNRLCPSGLLVIGVQDVRDENGKLWPLGMLVLEDVQRAIGSIRLRLKEFIVVVENGHARKRDDVVSRETFVDEKCIVGASITDDIHVPIVHAYYLVFMKLK